MKKNQTLISQAAVSSQSLSRISASRIHAPVTSLSQLRHRNRASCVHAPVTSPNFSPCPSLTTAPPSSRSRVHHPRDHHVPNFTTLSTTNLSHFMKVKLIETEIKDHMIPKKGKKHQRAENEGDTWKWHTKKAPKDPVAKEDVVLGELNDAKYEVFGEFGDFSVWQNFDSVF